MRGDYDFSYHVPPKYYNSRKIEGNTCRIRYYFHSKSSNLKIYKNVNYVSSSLNELFSIESPSLFKIEVTFSVTIRERYYEWDYDSYWGWDCDYDHTSYDTDTLTLSKSFQVYPYNKPITPKFIYLYEYDKKYWGNLSEYDGNMIFHIGDSFFKKDKYLFYARFVKPFEYLQLHAIEDNFTTHKGIYYDNDLLIVQQRGDCYIESYDFFDSFANSCIDKTVPIEVEEFKKAESSSSWIFLLWLIVFVFINVVIYRIIRYYWHW